MTSPWRALAVVAVTALLAVTAGCGGDAGSSRSGDADADADAGSEGRSAAADVSTCKAEAKPARTPYGRGFPQDWPFPPRTVVFNAEDRDADGTIVTAVSELPFRRVLRFMNHDVVRAGFRIEEGETEARDAEAEWEGNGFRGRWAIRASATCPGETVVQVLSARE